MYSLIGMSSAGSPRWCYRSRLWASCCFHSQQGFVPSCLLCAELACSVPMSWQPAGFSIEREGDLGRVSFWGFLWDFSRKACFYMALFLSWFSFISLFHPSCRHVLHIKGNSFWVWISGRQAFLMEWVKTTLTLKNSSCFYHLLADMVWE